MHSEKSARLFADIVTAAKCIREWVNQADGAERAIYGDALRRSAIERQFQIISESAIRLDKLQSGLTESLAPEIDWRGIRGIGNFLRHQYDEIEADMLVDIIQTKLDALQQASERAIRTLNMDAGADERDDRTLP